MLTRTDLGPSGLGARHEVAMVAVGGRPTGVRRRTRGMWP